MEADLARNFHDLYERGRDGLSDSLRGQIERGRRVSAVDYNNAVDRIQAHERGLRGNLRSLRCDPHCGDRRARAPRASNQRATPAFCTLWTFAGMPAVTLPLLHAENGMPMGIQLVGRRGDDARLLRTARWLTGWAQELEHGEG